MVTIPKHRPTLLGEYKMFIGFSIIFFASIICFISKGNEAAWLLYYDTEEVEQEIANITHDEQPTKDMTKSIASDSMDAINAGLAAVDPVVNKDANALFSALVKAGRK